MKTMFFKTLTILFAFSMILSSPFNTFAHNDGDDETLYSIKGKNIDLTVIDHGFEGTINGKKVMADAGCGSFASLRIFLGDEEFTEYVTYNEATKRYGIDIYNYEKTHRANVSLKSVNLSEGNFILDINGHETIINFQYREKEGNHFKEITLTTNINGEEISFHYDGKACPKLMISFSIMILASYIF